MRQTAHQVVVNARQVINPHRGIVNQRQGFVIEDRALFNFDRHDDHVGTTKVFLQMVVDFDVSMILRQQI